jgi:hypothetical protein
MARRWCAALVALGTVLACGGETADEPHPSAAGVGGSSTGGTAVTSAGANPVSAGGNTGGGPSGPTPYGSRWCTQDDLDEFAAALRDSMNATAGRCAYAQLSLLPGLATATPADYPNGVGDVLTWCIDRGSDLPPPFLDDVNSALAQVGSPHCAWTQMLTLHGEMEV